MFLIQAIRSLCSGLATKWAEMQRRFNENEAKGNLTQVSPNSYYIVHDHHLTVMAGPFETASLAVDYVETGWQMEVEAPLAVRRGYAVLGYRIDAGGLSDVKALQQAW